MALKAKILGREALTKKLNALAPKVEAEVAVVKLQVMQDAAERISANAPTGATLNYMESIEADYIKNRPHQELIGIEETKDPSAAAVFAPFIWRFLEWGTAPHSTAKGGGTVAGKKAALSSGVAMHPGTAAQPHIFHVWRAMRKKAKERVNRAVSKAVRLSMGKK
ncbi:HK97 gp10 family phage protein [Ensifer sp. HO-A22]|uniref:HK97 gp10 family phage protein n=1 Tax=Ensifer oleiphilus TaxID=2742698 RepID=A0A7Y6Q911_9HYPH|nr:HK97 gp10 family phage protein [Ensifer oleiphilus]NVD41292.1 HK97 gp10 family phage protein [Ensifer oleiphilus]